MNLGGERILTQVKDLLGFLVACGEDFSQFSELLEIKELIARLETEMAADRPKNDLEKAGASATVARRIHRRAENRWTEGVPVEHQDLILGALEKLSSTSKRREEIYDLAAAAAVESSPKATHDYVKALVREENRRLAGDPNEAYNQRRFEVKEQDEHGGCSFYGYAPAAHAALLKSLMDEAWRVEQATEERRKGDNRTVAQRHADNFFQVLRWASNTRQDTTGHCALAIAVKETDEFNWEAKFASNVGVDLTLFDLKLLDGHRIIDYIIVHNRNGAVTQICTARRSSTFAQRLAMFTRDGCCVYPGCNTPISRCESHHVIPWSRGGPTHISNLAPLCPKHHGWNDDSAIEAHIAMVLDGIPVHIDANGNQTRNNAPRAKHAAGRYLTEQEE